jgi:hypothetical protein
MGLRNSFYRFLQIGRAYSAESLAGTLSLWHARRLPRLPNPQKHHRQNSMRNFFIAKNFPNDYNEGNE